MHVVDIMAKSPAVCTPETPLREVARMMVDHDCGAIPVVENRDNPRPVGIITDRDITCRTVAEGKNPLEMTAQSCLSAAVVTVTPQTSLDECARTMAEYQVRRVPVVDENGAVIGMVAQADIALNSPPQETARVVQEISDEEEEPDPPMGGAYSG